MKKTLDGVDIKSDFSEKKKKENLKPEKQKLCKMRHTFTGTDTQS